MQGGKVSTGTTPVGEIAACAVDVVVGEGPYGVGILGVEGIAPACIDEVVVAHAHALILIVIPDPCRGAAGACAGIGHQHVVVVEVGIVGVIDAVAIGFVARLIAYLDEVVVDAEALAVAIAVLDIDAVPAVLADAVVVHLRLAVDIVEAQAAHVVIGTGVVDDVAGDACIDLAVEVDRPAVLPVKDVVLNHITILGIAACIPAIALNPEAAIVEDGVAEGVVIVVLCDTASRL